MYCLCSSLLSLHSTALSALFSPPPPWIQQSNSGLDIKYIFWCLLIMWSTHTHTHTLKSEWTNQTKALWKMWQWPECSCEAPTHAAIKYQSISQMSARRHIRGENIPFSTVFEVILTLCEPDHLPRHPIITKIVIDLVSMPQLEPLFSPWEMCYPSRQRLTHEECIMARGVRRACADSTQLCRFHSPRADVWDWCEGHSSVSSQSPREKNPNLLPLRLSALRTRL